MKCLCTIFLVKTILKIRFYLVKRLSLKKEMQLLGMGWFPIGHFRIFIFVSFKGRIMCNWLSDRKCFGTNRIESYNLQFTFSFLFSAKTIQLVNWTWFGPKWYWSFLRIFQAAVAETELNPVESSYIPRRGPCLCALWLL